jgi:uncharacterized RDD family membrane protein YckC
MSSGGTPPGWYPDPSVPGQQRYWDGGTWTDHTAPGGQAGDYQAPVQAGYGYAAGGVVSASFGQRFLAYLLDLLIVGVPVGIVFQIAYAISEALGWLVYLLGLAAIIYYFARFEGGPEGQTIGKKQLGIRVVDANTLQPGIGAGRAVGRYFSRIISSFLCALGYFWMLWDPQQQTWHDKLVSTRVVKA